MDLAEVIVEMDHYAVKVIRTFVKMVEYASKLNLTILIKQIKNSLF